MIVISRDIYFHIELKISGKWEHYACPTIERFYGLFALLSGVKDHEIEPISKPKGLPSDLSIITDIAYEISKEDAYSMSWLNSDEILKLSNVLQKWETEDNVEYSEYNLEYSVLHTFLFGNAFSGYKIYDDEFLPDKVEDIRFVFWFSG